MGFIKNIVTFFQKGIWDPSLKKRFPYSWLRIVISSIQGFIFNKGFDKASTLTFYSLLAIIPLVAIGFGIAQELGFEENFQKEVQTQLQSQPEIAEKIIQFSHAALKTTKGGLLASFGVIVLLWTVIKTIGNIESFFNEIWEVKTPRTLWQQVKSYLPLILLFPVFLVVASSIILYSSTLAIMATESIKILDILGPAVTFIFHLLPYLLNWVLLSFLYIYLPNTKVSWKAGILAGIITGILFSIWQWIYITFQVNAASYGAIYGSFAALPLFLIWLNYSWLIIIFGAEIAYHIDASS